MADPVLDLRPDEDDEDPTPRAILVCMDPEDIRREQPIRDTARADDETVEDFAQGIGNDIRRCQKSHDMCSLERNCAGTNLGFDFTADWAQSRMLTRCAHLWGLQEGKDTGAQEKRLGGYGPSTSTDSLSHYTVGWNAESILSVMASIGSPAIFLKGIATDSLDDVSLRTEPRSTIVGKKTVVHQQLLVPGNTSALEGVTCNKPWYKVEDPGSRRARRENVA